MASVLHIVEAALDGRQVEVQLLERSDGGTQDFLFRTITSGAQQYVHALLYINGNHQGHGLLLTRKTRRNKSVASTPRVYRICLVRTIRKSIRVVGIVSSSSSS